MHRVAATAKRDRTFCGPGGAGETSIAARDGSAGASASRIIAVGDHLRE
jgi:hypothetical protein